MSRQADPSDGNRVQAPHNARTTRQQIVTHRQLLKEVWGPLHVEEGHDLRMYMRQLRNKLENNPANPKYLVTELGVRYRLKTESS